LVLAIELNAGRKLGTTVEQYAQIAPRGDFIRAMDGDRPALPKVVAGRRS
jgi:hypothetical protein